MGTPQIRHRRLTYNRQACDRKKKEKPLRFAYGIRKLRRRLCRLPEDIKTSKTYQHVCGMRESMVYSALSLTTIRIPCPRALHWVNYRLSWQGWISDALISGIITNHYVMNLKISFFFCSPSLFFLPFFHSISISVSLPLSLSLTHHTS